MIKKICAVLIVILLLVAVFACYMYSKANDYRVEISNLIKENELSSTQFEEQILVYEKEISELNIYLDSVEESLKEVNTSYQDR